MNWWLISMKISTKDILNKWKLYTLTNNHNMKVSFLDFGGVITEIIVPDKNNTMKNVVLGLKNYADYENNPGYLGAITGRVAGRIQEASFTVEDKTYTLEANEGIHHLHGGTKGLFQVIWKTKPFQTDDAVGVELTHTSIDGDGGYPGNLELSVTYTLNNDNEFTISYSGTTDKTTALTLTNHSYFNLSGNLADTVHDHYVTMDSSQFVELNQDLIPTGKILDVADTSFDFRHGRKIADGINSVSEQNKFATNGYDHYFIFDQKKRDNIVVKDEVSGRVLTIQTDQPGIVMYTGNQLDEDLNLAEGKSRKYLGVCLETQASPASLHHEGFPTVILKPNETYQKQTVFSFKIEQ